MKKKSRILLLILLLFIKANLAAQVINFETLIKLEDLFPREEGTIQEKQTFDLIMALAKQLKVKYQLKSVNPLDGQAFSYSHNLEIFIPGATENEVLYLVPISMNSASLFPALLLIEKLSLIQNDLKVGARFVFLGAEEGETDAYPMGTKAFLETYSPPLRSLFFYFNLQAPSHSIHLWNSGDIPPPLSAIQQAKRLFRIQKISVSIPGFSTIVSRLLPEKTSLMQLYLDEQLPGLRLSSFSKESHKNLIDLERWGHQISDGFFTWHQQLEGISDTIDLNYLTIGPLILSETDYLKILVVLFLIFLTKIYRKKMSLPSINSLLKYGRFLFLTLLITFSSFFLSGLISESLQILKNTELLESGEVIFLVTYKILLGYFIFRIFLNHTHLKPTGLPTLKIAMLISLALFAVFSFINITFGWPFLWFSLLLLLRRRLKNKYQRLFLLISSSLFIVLNMLSLFRIEHTSLTSLLLFSDVLANITISLVLLPVIISLLSLYREKHKIMYTKLNLSILPLLAILVCTLLIVFYQDFQLKKQPLLVYMQEDLNLDFALLNFSSPRKIKEIIFGVDGKKQEFKNVGKNLSIETRPIDHIEIIYSLKNLMKLKNLNFNIYSKYPIVQYEINLTSKENLFITNINYPINNKINANGMNEITILTGKNPPNPLNIQAIINDVDSVIIQIKGTAEQNTQRLEVYSDRFNISNVRYMNKEIELLDTSD